MPPDSTSIAYDELVLGSLSQPGYAELVAAARRAIGTVRGQAAAGELAALLTEPNELVGELVKSGGLHRVVQAATDGSSFARQLATAFRYLLIDLHRATDAGALAQRIKAMLRRDDRFVQITEGANKNRWATEAALPDAIWDQDEDALLNAVWMIDVDRVPDWEGERRTPVCTDNDLGRLLVAAIDAADAPLEASQITRVARHRFQLLMTEAVALDDVETRIPIAGSAESEALANMEAREVFDELTPEQRTIVERWDVPVRELATVLGCSKSTAANKRARLREHLSLLGWTDIRDSSSDMGDATTGDEI